jgi:hypothetical protein
MAKKISLKLKLFLIRKISGKWFKKMGSKQQNNSNTSHLAPLFSTQMAPIGPKQAAINNQIAPVMPKHASTVPI